MKKAREITLDDVAGAYAATGLKPAFGHATVFSGQCCGLGALCVLVGDPVDSADDGNDPKLAAEILGLTKGSAQAFAAGFDCGLDSVPPEDDGVDYMGGYEIGVALVGWEGWKS